MTQILHTFVTIKDLNRWFINLDANPEMLPQLPRAVIHDQRLIVFVCVFAGWAHVVCALYIPEVEFANVSTMEPIVLQSVPHERYNKVTVFSSRLRHLQCNYQGFNLFSINIVHLTICMCLCRHVISVKTRAERVKQPLELV